MIIVFDNDATEEQIQHLCSTLKAHEMEPSITRGASKTIVGAIGNEDNIRLLPLESFPGVESVMPITKPYRLASREFQAENSVINIGDKVKIGGKEIIIMAGPCSVEGHDIVMDIANEVKKCGAHVLRGGAFKPRSSPYAFQGMGEEGLKILKAANQKYNLPIVTEVMNVRDVELCVQYADMVQIGARNMQNFDLLKEVGKYSTPVLLKRGMSATITELLMSAEYIMKEGNANVILCERGIRTFSDGSTRNTLDINAIAVLKQLTHLPVVIDPSHATGFWNLVESASKAAVAAGADGLIIEVHTCPEEAFSDGGQSLLPKKFAGVMERLKRVALAVDREIV